MDQKDEVLNDKKAEIFHSIVTKPLYVSKRARPNIEPTIVFLCTRISEPNEGDWKKLQQVLSFLHGIIDDY